MKAPAQGQLLTGAVVATTVVLIAFAVLQYRSSREITEATGVRLADTLQMSLVNWHVDFERNFTDITRALDLHAPGDASAEALAAGLADWRRSARYPGLVRGLFVHEAGRGGQPATTRRVLPDSGMLVPHDTLALRLDGPGSTAWMFHPGLPALTRPIAGSDVPRWLVVAIDPAVLRETVLPALALRYFSGTDGLDYEVAVFTAQPAALWASDAGFSQAQAPDADGILNVFGRRSSPQSGGPFEVFHTVAPQAQVPSAAITWFALPEGSGDAGDWRLVVRHRRGGALGAFLANTQRRDLVATLGALALLVASIALLVVASHRAQRLATLQMDFVAAVSHELRTPLTVIASAADNISRGVVREQTRVAEYGTVIGQQVRQLASLVERILLFAGQGKGTRRPLQPITVTDAIDATLASTVTLADAGQFTIERVVESDLPPVLGDQTALTQCVENLVTNALKYSGNARWIGVHAFSAIDPSGTREVRVAVTDRGLGIDPADRGRIFEPFYRSPVVVAAQIHGTGLGLALARSMATLMGGRITVESEPGRGSTFTLHLPVAPDPEPG
ncbi:MAG: HAMP domain-containing sensor histidine kinase [Vicinamibacterales bacterium]